MKTPILFNFLLLLVVGLPSVHAQTGWYLGIQNGAKLGFSVSTAGDSPYLPNENAFGTRILSYDDDVVSLASQHGLRFGWHFRNAPLQLESGFVMSGFVHNFLPIFDSKDYLGDKMKPRLTFYVYEIPLTVEYLLPFKMKSMRLGVFLGGKINIWGYRPYWGESFPWKRLPEAKPETFEQPIMQTVYYLPNSDSQERRYISAYNARPEYTNPYYTIVGGMSACWPLKNRFYLRASASYTQGFEYRIYEYFEVKTMERDDFGVLVFSSPQKGFESYTKLSNLALDLTFLVYLGKP